MSILKILALIQIHKFKTQNKSTDMVPQKCESNM